MSNDIVLSSDVQTAFPGLVDQLKRAHEMLSGVESFADIERLFLRGAGLSPNTYRSYLEAVKQFYEFDNRSPLQVIAADIERFYDHIVSRVSLRTAANRISGLRKFFANIADLVPFYTSPFEGMDEKLREKFGRTGKGAKKKALTLREIRGLLSMLRGGEGWEAQRDHAIVLFLYTTGLRAAEFCSLTWGDVEDVDGTWIATFVQKGGDTAEQEIPAETVRVAKEAHLSRYGRKPRPEEPVFASHAGTRLIPQTLWTALKRIEARAIAEGVLSRKGVEFSAHLFRRTAGTHLMRKGMDVVSIQKFMRHKNFATTARHYIDTGESAAPIFGDILGQEITQEVSRGVA